MKVICVLLPHFPLRCEILRHPDLKKCPAVITYGEGSQKLVLDYSPEMEGLQKSTPVQQALARYGKASLVQADLPYYWSVFNRILDEMENIRRAKAPMTIGRIYLKICIESSPRL